MFLSINKYNRYILTQMVFFYQLVFIAFSSIDLIFQNPGIQEKITAGPEGPLNGFMRDRQRGFLPPFLPQAGRKGKNSGS
jgi:hypothetical protein